MSLFPTATPFVSAFTTPAPSPFLSVPTKGRNRRKTSTYALVPYYGRVAVLQDNAERWERVTNRVDAAMLKAALGSTVRFAGYVLNVKRTAK